MTIEQFFNEYGAQFRNPERMNEFYGECAIACTPEAVMCLKGRPEVEEAMTEVSRSQSETGLRSLTPMVEASEDLDAHHVFAKVRWHAEFEKTGEVVVEFANSYLLRRTESGFHVICSVAHQSEIEMRRELGLD
jgi:hypothetical protein